MEKIKKNKSEKREISLQCLDCGKVFTRKLGPESIGKVTCPKCKSADVDIE